MYKLMRKEGIIPEKIDSKQPIFVDTETTPWEGHTIDKGGLYGRIRLVQFYQRHWKDVIIVDCQFVPLQSVLNLLQHHFLVFHNAAYDLHTINLKTSETWLPKEVGDTIYLARLKWWTKQKFGFYDCLEYENLNDDLIDSIDKKAEQKSDWSGPLSKKQLTYAACDVLYLAELYEMLKEFKDQAIYRLDIENLYLAVEYTRNGLPSNQETVKQFKLAYSTRLETSLDWLPINPRSTKQTPIYLGTATSDDSTLVRLIQQGDEKAKQVKEARHCYKMLEYLNNYDRPLIRGFFQPCTALSGRFSCTGGNNYDYCNCQQIPNILKDCIDTQDENIVLVYKDYSGLELRMATAYTGEPLMAAMYKAGVDLHDETAKYIFGIEEFTDQQRDIAKYFNFGLIYGAGAKGIQDLMIDGANLHLPLAQVSDLRSRWFDMYEYYEEWHKLFKRQMSIYGYVDVETALGRKVRCFRLTEALNTPIQGSSVEVTKMSLALLKKKHKDARIIHTCHDSNMLLSPLDEADDWGQALSDAMIEGWKYVIDGLADPDIPMPGGYDFGPIWVWH